MKSKLTYVFCIIFIYIFACNAVCYPCYAFAAGTDTFYEAELTEHNCKVYDSETLYYNTGLMTELSGGKCLFLGDNNVCTFRINVTKAGYYRLIFSAFGGKQDVKIPAKVDGTYLNDGEQWLFFVASKNKFSESAIGEKYYFTAGEHTLQLDSCWAAVDYFRIEFVEDIDYQSYFNADYKLSNPNATCATQKLFSFIKSNYGKNIISGQHTNRGCTDPVFSRIKEKTGKLPAILGLDLMEYSTAIAKYAKENPISYAIEYAHLGGIITFDWSWVAPEMFLKDDNGNWLTDEKGNITAFSGFREWAVNMDLTAVMNDESSKGYAALMNDIDDMAKHLKRLADADIPVLFRPLHEASGGWFWWGKFGAEPYIKLWRVMYEKFTNEHKLNNLIWVWNGQSKSWYPGDEYVDISGVDIYADPKDYGERAVEFASVLTYSDTPKIAALTETGTLFDVDKALENNAAWSWFLTWCWKHAIPENENDEYIHAWEDDKYYEVHNELYMWQKVYNHENVLTLADSPFHTHIDNGGDKICDVCNADVTQASKTPSASSNGPLIFAVVALAATSSGFMVATTVLAIKRKKRAD